MWVPGLAAAAAPPAGRAARAEVGPLAEVGLAQDDGAGLSEPGHQRRIGGRRSARHGQRARGGEHAVAGVDVVLEQHGNAVEWPPFARLGVKLVGDRQRVGVQLDHRPQLRPLSVHGGYALQVHLDQASCGEAAQLFHGELR